MGQQSASASARGECFVCVANVRKKNIFFFCENPMFWLDSIDSGQNPKIWVFSTDSCENVMIWLDSIDSCQNPIIWPDSVDYYQNPLFSPTFSRWGPLTSVKWQDVNFVKNMCVT